MFSTLALAAAIGWMPNQAPGKLSISNVRQTYCELGSTRPSTQYLQRDVIYISFDIEGLKLSPEGKVVYVMGMEVLDKVGKAVYTGEPKKSEMLLPLGGTKLPAFVYVLPGMEMSPGPFTCKVTVTDEATKATTSFEQKFELMPPNFGIVGLQLTKDPEWRFASGMAGIVGQTIYVNFWLVDIGRDGSKKPNAAVECRIVDASSQATTQKPLVMPVPLDTPEQLPAVHFQVMLPLNREGSYTVELKAVDRITNKSATLSFPMKIYPGSK